VCVGDGCRVIGLGDVRAGGPTLVATQSNAGRPKL
jgi:hypothetical protein